MALPESIDTMGPRFRGDDEKGDRNNGKKDATSAKAEVQRSPDITSSLSSVESLRTSLPESYQSLFDTLRKEVIDFCDLRSIPTSFLNNDEALREATKHLSLPDLEHLSLVLKRLEYLVIHKEPIPEAETTDPLEYAEKHYNLQEQYTSQISLLREIGILDESDEILVIDDRSYPIPTLEQIALRLFERRRELAPKHDQGFTKLLLVPFGMSLDTLLETLKQFLLSYKKKHPDFELNADNPLWVWEEGYKEVDIRTNPDGSPVLVYHPTSFAPKNHQGKSKVQILKEQSTDPSSFPGWTIHLLQPAGLSSGNLPSPLTPSISRGGKEGDQGTLGIAPIPREGQGKTHGQDHEDPIDPMTPSRPDIEAHKTPKDYLSILQSSQHTPDSPYFHETGFTPEDWILAFILHLQETGKLLDNVYNPSNQESYCLLIGAFFPFSACVPGAYWDRGDRLVDFGRFDPGSRNGSGGSRFSVMI